MWPGTEQRSILWKPSMPRIQPVHCRSTKSLTHSVNTVGCKVCLGWWPTRRNFYYFKNIHQFYSELEFWWFFLWFVLLGLSAFMELQPCVWHVMVWDKIRSSMNPSPFLSPLHCSTVVSEFQKTEEKGGEEKCSHMYEYTANTALVPGSSFCFQNGIFLKFPQDTWKTASARLIYILQLLLLRGQHRFSLRQGMMSRIQKHLGPVKCQSCNEYVLLPERAATNQPMGSPIIAWFLNLVNCSLPSISTLLRQIRAF